MDTRAGGAFPVPDREDDRLADLYDYGILDTAPESTYEDLTRLAAKVCGKPMAAITFIDEERQWVKAEVGGGAQTSPRSESFCAHAITDPEELFVVEDTTQHPAFEDNPYVEGEPELRFYAGAPIRSYRGHGLGTICVLDTEPGSIGEEERKALGALSRTVTLQLELRRRSQQLRHANDDVDRLTQAVSEEIREGLSVMELGLHTLANRCEDLDEEAEQRLQEARQSARRITRTVDGLEEYARAAGEEEPMSSLALREALEEAKETLAHRLRGAGTRVEGHGLPVVWADERQIAVLLRKLLARFIDPEQPPTAIHVTAHRGEDRWRIELTPEGGSQGSSDIAMEGEASDDAGMGLALCRRILDRHGGELGIEEDGEASVWFTLPGPAA